MVGRQPKAGAFVLGVPETLGSILRPEDNNFGLLRLAAAASVVLTHAAWLSTGDNLSQPLSGFGRYNLGQHAVHLFFVLSGLMVAGSLDRSASLVEFALARALRILPGLLVCASLTAFLLGPVVSSFSPVSYFSDARTYLYPLQVATIAKITASLPGVFETTPVRGVVNEPLWTLKYEVFCYAGLAILSSLGALRSSRAFLAVFLIAFSILVPLTWKRVDPVSLNVAHHFARLGLCFLIGVAFYRYRSILRLHWLAVAGGIGAWWIGRGTGLEAVLTFLLTGYLGLMLATVPIGFARTFTNRSDLSYGVYIYGWPVTQALVWAVPGLGPVPAAVVSLGLAGMLAWFSWTWVEQPSLKARNRLRCLLAGPGSRLWAAAPISPSRCGHEEPTGPTGSSAPHLRRTPLLSPTRRPS